MVLRECESFERVRMRDRKTVLVEGDDFLNKSSIAKH
jgi:hypothetical protein